MRIVILAPARTHHTSKWLRHLVDHGYDVHAVTSAYHYARDNVVPGAHYYLLRGPWKTAFISGVAAVRRVIRAVEPSVVHAHHASSYGTLGRLTRFHPYILSVLGSDVFDFPYSSPLHAALVRANLEAADYVCSTSEVMATQVRRLIPQPNHLEVVPFGVNLDVFRPITSLRDPDTFVVGTVKALAPKYGIDVLIRAFALARSIATGRSRPSGAMMRLIIVGEGPQKSKLEKLARTLGVHKATQFVGAIPNVQVPSLLNRFDAYAALSRLDSESFGVAIVEASACGLPVLVSSVGGLPEVVDDNVTGIVVEKENVQAAAKAMLRLMDDPWLRARMGEAGRRRVATKYNWSDNAAQMERVYARAVG
jgi:glycosyltransferase involved in cell wall biosynthesis